MKKFLLILLLGGPIISLFAQQGFYQAQNIEVSTLGSNLTNPWAGGINVPQFSPIDLNNDGILDLVIFDKNGDQLNCYVNNGIPGQVDYHYAPEYNQYFPEIQDWVLLRDYNCDDKADIFTSSNGSIKVFKNTSNANNLSFELIGTIFTDRGNGPTNIYVSSVDIPHIGDIDYDGDIDILTFTNDGSQVEWHKNTSIENFGSCDSLSFEMADNCWGDFSENFANNSVVLNDCGGLKQSDGTVHSGSTITALDLNGDQSMELLLGDITFNNLVMLENSGPADDAVIVGEDAAFPNYDTSVEIPKFPASYYFDFDNDGKKDLIVSPNGNNVSHNYENVWFYKNQAEDNTVNLNLVKTNALQDQMIEVGSGAHPVFFDYNADGLMDLIVANYGYYINGGNFNSQLALYKNIGSLNSPAFELITDDFSGLGSLNFTTNLSPTFGDIDNDGDEDMLLGDSDGKLHLFTNIFSNGEANFMLSNINYFSIDVGSFASPQFADLDRDGDLDLIIGNRQGHLHYYSNEGNQTDADFVLNTDFFGEINLTDPIYNTAYTVPSIIDTEDGYELYIGTEKGQIHHYNNIDDNLNGAFDIVSDSILLYSHGIRFSPSLYDLNNDGWNDMLLGVFSGGIHLLWGSSYEEVKLEETVEVQLTIFPNPSDGIINVASDINIQTIRAYNLSGQLVAEIEQSSSIDLSHLDKGLYILELLLDSQISISRKVSLY